MARIPKLTPDQLSAAQADLYQAITGGPRANGPQLFELTDEHGGLNGPFNAFLLAPKLGNAIQELGSCIRYGTSLSDRLRELAILVVAAQWDSEFERTSHEAVARHIGFTDAELHAIRELDFSDLSVEEAHIAEIVSHLLDGDFDNEQWTEAQRQLSLSELFELTALVGYYSMLALQLRVFRV